MEAGIRFTRLYRDDDLVKVRIWTGNGRFSGEADVYLAVGQLATLAEQLRGFPTQLADTRELVWGTFDLDSAGGGVSMKFYCVDSGGHAKVDVRIKSDTSGEVQSARLFVPTEASAVDSFIRELIALEMGTSTDASMRAAVPTH